MRKFFIVVIILAILGAAGYFGYQQVQKRQAAQKPDYESVTVDRGDISATVSATGAVLPEREVSLGFSATGTIAAVDAEVGQQVGEGQVLAALDTTDLELAVRQAEIGVAQAQAQLRQLREKPNPVDVAAAQAALDSAQGSLTSARAAYQQTLKGPDADTLAASQAQVDQAKVQLMQAQQAYDKVKDRADVGMMPQSTQLQNATIALETAAAQSRAAQKSVTSAQVSASQAQVAAAEAQLAQAQAGLDKLERGPSAEQVAIAQAGVDQAQLALEQARRRLANAQLTAPWPGVVTTVAVVEGGPAALGQPAVRLADASKFHLDAQVDEVDIAVIQPGQAVQIEIDALSDVPLTGKVSRVSPSSTTSQTGGVSYSVRLDIDPTDAALLAGMSATATIIANTRENVLLIPNRVVQLERETGRTFVERVAGEKLERVEVKLGLRDDQTSEVREGLAEGDVLAIVSRTSADQLRDLFAGGPGQ
jgi:HlyD family secretion protein